MAIPLPAPITVQQGQLSGAATHEQLGATIQPWNDPAILLYMAACNVDADGRPLPIDGVRSDTGERSPTYATLTEEEEVAMTSHPDWQAGLAIALAMYRYIASDRDPALKPAWIP